MCEQGRIPPEDITEEERISSRRRSLSPNRLGKNQGRTSIEEMRKLLSVSIQNPAYNEASHITQSILFQKQKQRKTKKTKNKISWGLRKKKEESPLLRFLFYHVSRLLLAKATTTITTSITIRPRRRRRRRRHRERFFHQSPRLLFIIIVY